MNWVLIGLTVLFYPLCTRSDELTPLGRKLVIAGESWFGIVGHVLVHRDLIHLFGNMIFLWVFGNAVCAKVGNIAYPFIYFGLGVVAGLAAVSFYGLSGAGASGAINGIAGMFVVWYAPNEMSCWYGYIFFYTANTGTFSVSSYWMIALWFAFDVWGFTQGTGDVGYVAHLVGLAAGFALAIVLTLLRWVEMDRGERWLSQLFAGEE
jgi:membrane associated rhomboid family serine protease